MTILEKIVTDTRDLIAQRKSVAPIGSLISHPAFSAPTLSLEQALRRHPISIIAEIKKASPSVGTLRSDFDVQHLARRYKLCGASAVSVLTEPFHFQGSLQHLGSVRQTIDLPLLRKDFIIDEYQLYEARAFGADAVLLIAAILEKKQLADLLDAATEMGLSCLVEVYDAEELDKIDFDRVRVLGVNNRDLRTFKVDLNHTLRVLRSVPASVVKVSESGLKNAADIAYLRDNGVDAFLIGETFMRAEDPGVCLHELLSEARMITAPTHLKRAV